MIDFVIIVIMVFVCLKILQEIGKRDDDEMGN